MASLSRIKQKLPAYSWARLVSDLVSPPVVWAILVIPVALQYSRTTAEALMWSALYSFFICVIPLGFVAYMVKIGRIGDIHMKERRERLRPLLLSIICTTIVWWLLRVGDAPPALPLLALISLIQISIIALITLVWQISMHMMSIAGAAIAVGIIFSMSVGFLMVPLVPLVGAARLKLKRHTPAQIVAGTIIGALVPVLLLMWLPMSLIT